MVYVGTFLNIVDNTGGFSCLCVKIYSNSKKGVPGNVVLVAVKSVLINRKIAYSRKKKVNKGTVRKCLLVKVSYTLNRWGNMRIKFNSRGVALIGKWDLPVGSRIYGPVQFESRLGKYIRVSMLSEGSF